MIFIVMFTIISISLIIYIVGSFFLKELRKEMYEEELKNAILQWDHHDSMLRKGEDPIDRDKEIEIIKSRHSKIFRKI